jgi:hypothetical protein
MPVKKPFVQCEIKKAPRRGAKLRHAFVTFHMARHAHENLTPAEAGNSPQMIHDHYRALATRKEALKWFGIRPARSARAENVIELKPMVAAAGKPVKE